MKTKKKTVKVTDIFKKWVRVNFWKGEQLEVLANQDAITFYRKFPRAWTMKWSVTNKKK